MDPPRAAVGLDAVAVTEQTNCIPETPFTVAAVPAPQTAEPPLFTVTVGGFKLLVNPLGVKMVKTTFGAGVKDVLETVQVMLPAWPTLGFGAWAFPATETAVETLETAGNGTVVASLVVAFASSVPASSVPLATTVLRIA